ncbi:MAG: hypothetical protein V4603_10920 [Pseudomonadota bacterium]
MEAGARNTGTEVPPEPLVPGLGEVPGLKESVLLALDSGLTLFKLFKSEASLALHTLPIILALDLYRIPTHLLTWLSLCGLVAAGVQRWTDNWVWTAAAFFSMQLLLTIAIEMKVHQLQEKMSFPESRKGLESLQASLKQRFKHENA